DVFGSYRSGNFYPGTFTAGVMTQSETTAEAIDAIIEQVERLQNEPISEEELQETKDQFLNSIVFQYDSKSKVLNQRLSNEYAGLPKDSFDKLVEEIKSVTISDVQRVANEYLRPENLQILVVGNESEIGDQLDKFGNVNEIDITIPEPGSDESEESVAGDAAKGKEWLGKMANAVLPSLTLDGNLVVESENIINAPQGEMSLDSREELNFEENEFIAEVNAPFGKIVTEISNGNGVMKMGGQERAMPPAQMEQTLGQYSRNFINIALNLEETSAEYMGMEMVESVEYVHLKIKSDPEFDLFLNPETSLPAMIQFSQFNPQQGARQNVEVRYSDWKMSDGVNYAYETINYADGEQVAKTNVKSHSVE
ncbi:MAG TPA: insulinase family protein, partial [Balneolaceae bacterium]|nr:insulinase family protein [Balneolaceae bacterium]